MQFEANARTTEKNPYLGPLGAEHLPIEKNPPQTLLRLVQDFPHPRLVVVGRSHHVSSRCPGTIISNRDAACDDYASLYRMCLAHACIICMLPGKSSTVIAVDRNPKQHLLSDRLNIQQGHIVHHALLTWPSIAQVLGIYPDFPTQRTTRFVTADVNDKVVGNPIASTIHRQIPIPPHAHPSWSTGSKHPARPVDECV